MRVARAGFSLIEIVVAISILSILAAIMVPVVSGILDDAKVANAKSDLDTLKKAYLQFYADTGQWPGNDNNDWNKNNMSDTLDSDNYPLYADTLSLPGWDGPYLERGAGGADGTNMAFTNAANDEGLLDPWGYRYRVKGFAAAAQAGMPAGGMVVYSRGPDNATDTSDADLALGKETDDDIVLIVTVKP